MLDKSEPRCAGAKINAFTQFCIPTSVPSFKKTKPIKLITQGILMGSERTRK